MTRQRLPLAFILLSGLLLRLGALNDPVTYDEAYTYVGFASRSLWAIVSDYSLPNNHVFHSLLVSISTHLFGNHLWSLRLPALLAGMGLIWVAYRLGQVLSSRETGWLAAALAAWFPELIHYATDARGYSLIGLFTLLIFWLGGRLSHQPTRRDWILLALVTALGFWTIPLMLYPAGGVYLWLLLEMSLRGGLRRSNLRPWLLSGLGAGLLTLALYAPVLLISGWRKLLANGFVQPLELAGYFNNILPAQIADTWQVWTRDVPPVLTLLLALGFILSLAFSRQRGLTLALALWVALLVLTRRPAAYDRFWSWLIAPLLVWSAAGLAETVRKLKVPVAALTGLALVGLLASLAVNLPTFPERWSKVSNAEAAALYLKDALQPGQVVLAGYPNNAPVWYYLARYGVPETAWQSSGNFSQAYVLLAANQDGQTLASVIKSYKLAPADFALDRAEGLTRYGQILIYRLPKR
jgi:uncharacterized membrane protein